MTIRFLSNNLAEGSILTASSENAQFPVSNILDDRRTKVFRSNSNSDNLVIDMGNAEDVDSFAVVDNWQGGFGFTTLTLEANGTDDWGSPAFSEVISFDNEFGVGVKEFTEVSYRFWRIVMTGSLGYCELSNFFIGKASKVDTNGVGYNWSYKNKDLSRVSSNRYGQEFIDDIGTQKELSNLQFQVMNKDEIDVLLSVWDNNRRVKPFFIYFPLEKDSLVNNDNRYNGMYKFSRTPTFTNINSGFYNTSISLKENK